jgi:hypothetical protein
MKTRLRITCVVNKYMEPYDVSIMRPGPFGNPFLVGRDGDRDKVCDLYEKWLPKQKRLIARMKAELRYKRLGCCCAPKRCHGETIVRAIRGEFD